jgi:hypothetical protein
MSSMPLPSADDPTGDDVIDLEQYVKDGRAVPKHRHGQRYRIRIDKTPKVVDVPQMTGEQILGLVGKASVGYRLDQKLRGGLTKKVESNDVVDFTTPGIERFMTLPLDQTEGGTEVRGRTS